VITITRSKCGIPISDIFFANNVDEGPSRAPLCFFQQTSAQHPTFKPVHWSTFSYLPTLLVNCLPPAVSLAFCSRHSSHATRHSA
jgi:hypothetical protein